MRIFIAVPVDDNVRQAAAGLIAQLSQGASVVRWSKAEDMHLTLSFLGETPEERILAIAAAMDETAAGHSRFEILFDRIGAFGAPSHPRILWLGIGAGAKVLTKLASTLKAHLGERGIRSPDDPDREFTAHLTLGRVKGDFDPERLKTAKVPPGLSCRVEKLALFQSKHTSGGQRYRVLREAPLSI